MSLKVYRHKFTQEIMDKLLEFNRIHRYDTKEAYKEAWKIWIEHHKDILLVEERRLCGDGYSGDFMAKLYHSSRYYVRNQILGLKQENVTAKKKTRHRLPKEIIESMDAFLKVEIYKDDFKPSNSYNKFLDTYYIGLLQAKELNYKKGFMNRYFVLKSKIKGIDNI